MYKKIQIKDFRIFKNQTLLLGKYLTVLSGRNSTGKSTILGMLANSGELKKKEGVTYTSKRFRAEFSELFKGSKNFDKTQTDRFVITLCDKDGNDIDFRSFRTAWQSKGSAQTHFNDDHIDIKEIQSNNNLINNEKKFVNDKKERFRVIPFKKLEGKKKTEAKFDIPVLYLGLSRLFPVGESHDEVISSKKIQFSSEEHRNWFVENYTQILSMQTDIQSITNFSISETDKKSGIGVCTNDYDYLTNSSGQDNLGQILLAILSFIKLKEEQNDLWKGGLLLIDEIDATLHPAAQIKLIKLLIKSSKKYNFQVVLTTHSLSFLKEICLKIKFNNHDEDTTNDIELYYLTNANRKLEIKRNPYFSEIEQDLMIVSAVQSSVKIKLYSEDEEARWFLKSIIPKYLPYIDVLDINIGCNELISLYKADLQYFGNTLIVFDGDVSDSQLNKIDNKIRTNLNNILKLPGDKRPEEVLYDYLICLDKEHDFWTTPEAQLMGFTWDYFHENGPKSDKYKGKKEREKYKSWFKDHQQGFEITKLMDFWIRDNQLLVKKFSDSFLKSYNHISVRTMVMPICIS